MSLYRQHVAKWRDCQGCTLCSLRKNVVLARGTIPCQVLFIGEAPGPSEDVLGLPFKGPAGHLLDTIIERAWGDTNILSRPVYAFTNVVACFPKLTPEEVETTKKTYRDPSKEEMDACEGRLIEFVRLCKPQVIVMVGTIAKKRIYGSMFSDYNPKEIGWLPKGKLLRFIDIVHPAAILKADITQQEVMARRSISALEEVLNWV